MIYKALMLIKTELEKYLKPILNSSDNVLLGNIAFFDLDLDVTQGEADKLYKNIVLSLLRIEEEPTLRNAPHYGYNPVRQTTEYKNPPVPLNLYLMFTTGTGASTSMQDYCGTSLKYLAHIVKFFQGKKIFTNVDTPIQAPLSSQDEELESFELIMDLYSVSFEEANYMWSTLGGRQLPHVCYKMRMLKLEREQKQEERGIIKEVALTT